jgi:hypothetical protein
VIARIGKVCRYQNTSKKVYGNLGPIYTKSRGQCSTQIKHSYWFKS